VSRAGDVSCSGLSRRAAARPDAGLSEYFRAHLGRNASEDGVLQITCDGMQFAPLPRRQGRVLRVHLGADVAAGLVTLQAALANALVRAEST
jgi:hypothetical protein